MLLVVHSDIFIRAGVFREEKREEQVLVKHSIIAFFKKHTKRGVGILPAVKPWLT